VPGILAFTLDLKGMLKYSRCPSGTPKNRHSHAPQHKWLDVEWASDPGADFSTEIRKAKMKTLGRWPPGTPGVP
jgi:hypothetical protein